MRVTALAGVALVCAGVGNSYADTKDKAGIAELQAQEYSAEVSKTILQLQQFRRSNSIQIADGTATLVNLNPAVNSWFVLTLAGKNGTPDVAYHLENAKPPDFKLVLDQKYPAGIVVEAGKERHYCALFGTDTLEKARRSEQVYSPLCEGRVYLRNPVKGNLTALESATEFIRDQVWGGEKVIVLFHHLLADSERETAELRAGAHQIGPVPNDFPAAAAIDPQYSGREISPGNLGIAIEAKSADSLVPGAWYPAAAGPGIYVSVIQPNFLPTGILNSYLKVVNRLDNVEASALSYLVAFDMDRFDLGYAVGTQHPRVGWDGHARESMKNAQLPGPDGIGSIAPLVSTGLLKPEDGRRAISTFTGGFKRFHGAFKYGELGQKNHGSHYGFIQDGVVFSKLQPGLATAFVLDDGAVEMKTWSVGDNALLPRIRHARQNGVAIIDFDEKLHGPAPGPLVNNWGAGNWSGSADSHLRTLRGGLALQKRKGKRFLIYGVFSDSTPSAMARIFQAYGCDYAMLLDMNALEHTYCAVYRQAARQITVDHLIKGMSQLDKTSGGQVIPRFLGYPDNRDFFYVMRRNVKEAKQ